MKTLIETETKTETNVSLIRYAWGNETLKTWFITDNANVIMPKSSRLLFILTCEKTNLSVSTVPQINDVVCDNKNMILKITDSKYY